MEQRTNIHFYLTASDAWEAMYADCQHAKTSIKFEQYILNDDAIGNRFLELFSQKAKEGLKVQLILDKVGSWSVVSSSLIKEIRQNGGEVEFFNAITWLNLFLPSTWYPRNHTKTMVIDAAIAYVGSVCLAEYMHGWRDTQGKITGELVNFIEADFDIAWQNIHKRPWRRKKPLCSPDAGLRYVVNHPHLGISPIYKELLAQINNAQTSIYLTSPYFFPLRRMQRALYHAARRGVEVRIMMSEKSDVPLADYVAHSYFPHLLRRGMHMMLYTKTVQHAKYTVIDEHWATMGSSNLDYLSFVHNREANVIIRDKALVAELKQHFTHDVTHCIEVGPDFWQRRPLLEKCIGYAGRILRKVL